MTTTEGACVTLLMLSACVSVCVSSFTNTICFLDITCLIYVTINKLFLKIFSDIAFVPLLISSVLICMTCHNKQNICVQLFKISPNIAFIKHLKTNFSNYFEKLNFCEGVNLDNNLDFLFSD